MSELTFDAKIASEFEARNVEPRNEKSDLVAEKKRLHEAARLSAGRQTDDRILHAAIAKVVCLAMTDDRHTDAQDKNAMEGGMFMHHGGC